MRLLILAAAICAASLPVHSLHAAPKAAVVAGSSTKFHKGAPLPKWAQPLAPIPATKRSDPVVMRLHETQAVAGSKPAVLVNRAIQVNDKAALAAIGQFGIPFLSAYQSLHLHRVTIIRDGKELDRMGTVNVRMLDRELAMESNMYGGATTAQLLLDDVRTGDTLWTTYTIEGANPVFGNVWTDEFGWEGYSPVEHRKIVVTQPKGRPFKWRQLGDYNKEEIKPRIETAGEFERVIFEGKGIDGVEEEGGIPRDYLYARMIQFSEYGNWNDVAKWASSTFPAAKPRPEITELAQQFRKQNGKMAQASAALQWIQNEIRYFSVSIGENSHRPQAPDVVLKRRYGDCKDKSYLLVTVLKELGIEARPVLLSASAAKAPAKILATPTWFDHVIVQVTIDGKNYYVDPTQMGQPQEIAKIPPLFPGAAALLVAPESNALFNLPADSGTPLLYEIAEKLTVEDFESAVELHVTETWRGSFADRFRSQSAGRSANEIKRDALKMYEKQYPGVELAADPVITDNPAENEVTVTTSYSLPTAIKQVDGKNAIAYSARILEGAVPLPDKLIRKFPFRFGGIPVRMAYRLSIDWPEEVRAHLSPQDRSFDSPFFKASSAFSFRGNRTEFLLDFQVKKVEVEAAEMAALHRAARQLDRYTGGDFMVTKGSVTKAVNVTPRDLDAVRYSIDLATSDRQLKEMNDDDFVRHANCTFIVEAALQKDVMGSTENGMAKRWFQRLAKLDSPEARECRARLAFSQGAYGEALKLHLAKALAPSRELAWSQFYSGDKAAAVETMRQVLAGSRHDEEYGTQLSDMADLFALTRHHLGKAQHDWTLDATLYPTGPWPLPLLAWQAGALKQDALLKHIETYPVDARVMALAEAWFQIGHARLAEGNKAGARMAFAWVDENGFRSARYAVLARSELTRLPEVVTESAAASYEQGMTLKAAKEFDKAFVLLRSAAERGHGKAATEVGRMLAVGEGTQADVLNSFIWFERAANKGDPEGLTQLGYAFRDGLGTVVDHAKALKSFEAAANLGHALAQFEVGYRYAKGILLKPDTGMAAKWYRKAADQGNALAQNELGLLYQRGDGVRESQSEANRLFLQAAQQGSSPAMTNLGYAHHKGYNGKSDYTEARNWYLKAAELGNSAAMFYLAELAEGGLGGPVSLTESAAWHGKAAKGGDVDSANWLAKAYESNKLGKPDLEQSCSWLRRAVELGDKAAAVRLAGFYLDQRCVYKDGDNATDLLISAYEKGEASAAYVLGRMYELGKGGTQNDALAARWYLRAADGNISNARGRLIPMYEEGRGIERSPEKAKVLLDQLVRLGAVDTLDDLGIYYKLKKQHEKAEETFLLNVKVARTSRWPSPGEIAITEEQLADFYYARLKFDKSVEHAEKALEYFVKTYGKSHLETARATESLGMHYWSLGQLDKVKQYYQGALDIRMALRGPKDPAVAESLGNIAGLHRRLGEFDKAEQLFKQAVAIREETFGAEHDDTLAMVGSLGQLVYMKGQYDTAGKYLTRALTPYSQRGKKRDWRFYNITGNLAWNQLKAGNYPAAEAGFKLTLDHYLSENGSDSHQAAMGQANLAGVYMAMNRLAEAESLYKASLATREKLFGIDDDETAYSAHGLGTLYARSRRLAEAEVLLRRALGAREREQGNDVRKAETLHELGMVLKASGKPEARQMLERALAIRARIHPDGHPDLQETKAGLASL